MTEKRKVPEIRFAGYDGEWEERKAGEIFSTTADKNYPKLPVLSASQEYGMIRRDETGKTIYHDMQNETTYKRVLPGQFVIHLRSFQGGFAHSTIEGITSPAYTVLSFTEKEKDYDYFWKYIFSSLWFIRELEKITYGIRDGRSISYEDFTSMKFANPNYMEQMQIGSYFCKLDSLIALSQRKYDKLVNFKKTMLDKMFPKDGVNLPEVRFAGFTENWIKKKFLSNIKSIIDFRGRTPKKLGMNWSDGDYLALSALNVKDGYIDFKADAHYGDELLYRKWMSENELHKDQVLFTTEAPMGNVAQVPDNKKYILSQRTVAFQVDESFLVEGFLAYLLKAPKVFNDLVAMASGGTAKGVSQRSLEQLVVMIPQSLKEQTAIGNYFRNLDNLIAAQGKQLERLKTIKKAMLGKMFV